MTESTTFNYEILCRQDATTTSTIIHHFSKRSSSSLYPLGEEGMSELDYFTRLGRYETYAILQRDLEDATKIQKGIDLAISKGVLPPLKEAGETGGEEGALAKDPYIEVDVLGKTPDAVADEIWTTVLEQKKKMEGSGEEKDGQVIILCGLSGTGKGTTFAKLGDKLRSEGKEVVNWSNGNVFRSLTLLATTWCDNVGCQWDPDKALTKENLESFTKMLNFGKFNDQFDTRIQGLGIDALVSEIQNTTLKAPHVGKNIPTVAGVTQGEVVMFARDAIDKMTSDGLTVLLEGREQTLNYIPTKHKFRLVLSDDLLIGKRRAAQRLMASVLDKCKKREGDVSNGFLETLLAEEVVAMVKEAEKEGAGGAE